MENLTRRQRRNLRHRILMATPVELKTKLFPEPTPTIKDVLEARATRRNASDWEFIRTVFHIRSIPEERLNQMFVDSLTCHICTERLDPPMIVCVNGHITCSTCRLRWSSSCPYCRGNWTRYSSSSLQHFYNITTFPCKYTENGCNRQDTIATIKLHEIICAYKC